MNQIKNNVLLLSDIPDADGPFSAIERFGFTFNGYEEVGSFERCAEIARKRRHDTLTELRACLFFEQRRARHTGASADEEEEAYQRDLIMQIRARVLANDRN